MRAPSTDPAPVQRDAALATYELSIQTAFQETADALARQGTIADQLRANQNFANAALDTFRLSDARYRGGIDTFLNSLDAQRSLYTAQRNLVATQLVGASNRVTLYRVLGGDSTLEATASGLAASFLNAPVEHDDLRWLVRNPVSGVGRTHMLIRLGYGEKVPPTPRRPLDDVRRPARHPA